MGGIDAQKETYKIFVVVATDYLTLQILDAFSTREDAINFAETRKIRKRRRRDSDDDDNEYYSYDVPRYKYIRVIEHKNNFTLDGRITFGVIQYDRALTHTDKRIVKIVNVYKNMEDSQMYTIVPALYDAERKLYARDEFGTWETAKNMKFFYQHMKVMWCTRFFE